MVYLLGWLRPAQDFNPKYFLRKVIVCASWLWETTHKDREITAIKKTRNTEKRELDQFIYDQLTHRHLPPQYMKTHFKCLQIHSELVMFIVGVSELRNIFAYTDYNERTDG